jgi:hypothetical protein
MGDWQMNIQLTPMQMAIIGASAGLLGLIWLKKKPGQSLAGAAGTAAVTAAVDVASGAVVGVGEVFGIPATDMTECQKAQAEGRTWDASFACSAGDFLGYIWR